MENIREKVRREIDQEVAKALKEMDQHKDVYLANPFNTQTVVELPTPDNTKVVLGVSDPLSPSCQSSPSP